jgi:uncharacterized protein Yka (UPF0111/DUF47 family)
MTQKDSDYFKTTQTMMRRVRTMLRNLAERSDISDVTEKCNYAADKVENALSMLDLVDQQYASNKGCKQLNLFDDYGQ